MSRPIRVLELRSVWGTGGGPDKTILTGAGLHDSHRFAVTVCYIRDERDRVFALDRRALELGVDYVEVKEKHSFDAGIWPQLRKLIRSRGVDIVHAHDHKTDALTWALAQREPIVPLSTAHGFAGESWNERFYYAVEKRLLARFPRVIAVATHIKAELVRTGSQPDRVTVINNAIDHRAFRREPGQRDAARRSLGVEPSDVVIGAVGRLESEKRFDQLFEAFAVLRADYPRVRLVIAGEGSLRPSLTAQIDRMGLGTSVRLLGHYSDVIGLHNALDVFVQSSEREGTPNCVLEAMAMETPIVATSVGGTSELVVDEAQGLLVPRHDVPRLREALERVISDPESAHARAEEARRRVEIELSFNQRMRRVESVYEDLMRTASSAGALSRPSTIP